MNTTQSERKYFSDRVRIEKWSIEAKHPARFVMKPIKTTSRLVENIQTGITSASIPRGCNLPQRVSPTKADQMVENSRTLGAESELTKSKQAKNAGLVALSGTGLTGSTEFTPFKQVDLVTEPDRFPQARIFCYPKATGVAKKLQLRPESPGRIKIGLESKTASSSREHNQPHAHVDIPALKRGRCSLSPRAARTYLQQNKGDESENLDETIKSSTSLKFCRLGAPVLEFNKKKSSGTSTDNLKVDFLKLPKHIGSSSVKSIRFDKLRRSSEQQNGFDAIQKKPANLSTIGRVSGNAQPDVSDFPAPAANTLTVPISSVVSSEQMPSTVTNSKEEFANNSLREPQPLQVWHSDYHSDMEWMAPDPLNNESSHLKSVKSNSGIQLDTAVDLHKLLNESTHFRRFLSEKFASMAQKHA